LQDLTLIILAGGKNTRMKQEKAFLMIEDQRLIDKMVEEGKKYFKEIIVVTNEIEKYRYLDAIVISDLIPRQGPLAGIHAGLTKSSFKYSFVIACDMPFASMKLGAMLVKNLENEDVVVPEISGGFQPLQAIYGKSCLPVIEQHLKQGRRKTTEIFDELNVKVVTEEQLKKWGCNSMIFINVNTPQEFNDAIRMAKSYRDVAKNNC